MSAMLQARPATTSTRRLRMGLPPIPPWVAARAKLSARLDQISASSRLAVVTAPSGAGKTTLVASWANDLSAGFELCWLNVGSIENLKAISRSLPVMLPGAEPDQRLSAMAVIDDDIATATEPAAPPSGACVVVLDDFPAGPAELINSELDRLLRGTPAHVSFLLVCAGSPTLDLHLLGVDGETVPLTSADLVMDLDEIGEVLVRHGLDAPESTIRAVRDHTAGWACGVRLAALFLQRSGSVAAACADTDRAIARYLDSTVVTRLAGPGLELLTATSIVDDVAYGAAQTIVGPAVRRRLAAIEDSRGFVEVRADGSFRCHPLLRRLLRRRLWQHPSRARQAAHRAAEWFADQGDQATAVDIAIEAGDWAWAGRRLVESLAVSRLLVLGGDGVLGCPDAVDALGRTEPSLLAAVALRRSWPEGAVPAIERAERALTDGAPTVADTLSLALLKLAAARSSADPRIGLQQACRATGLLSQLSLPQRAGSPELIPLIQSQLGLFELWNDAPDRAREAFERGARGFRPRTGSEIDSASQIAAADCLGQLAWLEAVGGELTRAMRHASDVLTARPADSTEIGVLHAQLATVWSHIARGEVEQAGQRLDALLTRHPGIIDAEIHPEVAAATGLTVARLGLVVGDGGASRGVCRLFQSPPAAGWFNDQLRLARAEVELNAGQPAQALALLREPGQAGAETHVLRARAWIDLGDLASVGATLRVRPVEALTVATQVQLELIEAWLAQAHGDRHHQRVLIDRALRTAGREQLRTSLAWAKPWLHSAVTSDHALLHRHGVFFASIRPLPLQAGEADIACRAAPIPPTATLTQRELDILQQLGSLSTNDEIAADLFLSTNTVKTHLKSLFRKLEVTRRSDAFRRGRSLGLC